MPTTEVREPAASLHVEALAVAFQANASYRMMAQGDEALPFIQALGAIRGLPAERLAVRDGSGADEDVCGRALRALGVPDDDQPLYLVNPGMGPDMFVAVLPRLVQELGWRGEDIGITHLDEAGGTAVFGMLDWSSGPDGRATVLIADEPVFVDVLDGPRAVSAAAVRTSRDAGPLRVLGAGEGDPPAQLPGGGTASHEFGGPGPCDGWLALAQAALDGRLGDGDRVLIRASGASRRGWALFEVTDARSLPTVTSGPAAAMPGASGRGRRR
jgi:hypothetical protein